jgi:hypothetical protein
MMTDQKDKSSEEKPKYQPKKREKHPDKFLAGAM